MSDASLLSTEYRGVRRQRVDPLLIRGLVAGMDFVAVTLASAGQPDEWDLERGRRVMLRMLAASLAKSCISEAPPLRVAASW